MKLSDIGSSFFLMALGGFMAWQSMKLSLGSPRAPGPGFFPFCLGLLLIGFALIILVQDMRQKPRVRETGLRKGRVILALAAIFTYPFVLEPLGYLLTTLFLMFLLLKMMVKKGWWFAPVVACFISLLVLAFVLGEKLEEAVRQTLIYSRGDLSIFIQRPVAAVFLAIAFVLILSSLLSGFIRKNVGQN